MAANDRVGGEALTERAVWQLVREYAAQDAELDRLGDFLKGCKGGEVPKYRVCRRDCY